MPGEDSAIAGGVDSPLDEIDPDTPSIEVSDFEREWRGIVGDIRGKRRAAEVEERLSPEPFERAFELALSNPDEVSISTKPVGRRVDMAEHIHGDIERVLDSDWAERNLISPRPDMDTLLRLFEMGYLYDAVYRFLDETKIRPGEGLEEISFVELPPDLDEWMGEVNIAWGIASGTVEEEKPFDEMVDRLWDEREEFVEKAKSMDIFLPVPADTHGDPEDVRRNIRTHLSRNGDVDPELVHRYCYSRAVDY